MKIPRARLVAALFGILLAAGACLSPVKTSPQDDSAQAAAYRRRLAATVTDNWPPISALAARRLMEQYGPPDEVRPGYLVWNDNGPWRRTVVRDITPPYAQADDLGVVEQTIEYPLMPGQIVELAAFDQRLGYNAVGWRLSARSDSEEINFLRLNLANDILNKRMTAAQARELYEKTRQLAASGKTSPYMLSLRFVPW